MKDITIQNSDYKNLNAMALVAMFAYPAIKEIIICAEKKTISNYEAFILVQAQQWFNISGLAEPFSFENAIDYTAPDVVEALEELSGTEDMATLKILCALAAKQQLLESLPLN